MEFRLDSGLGDTLHKQIAAVLRRAISDGTLVRGSRLPTARELAGQLDVNANTVLRAYRALAADELVELRRGRGVTIRGEPNLAHLYELTDQLLAEAARLGITRGELAGLLAHRS